MAAEVEHEAREEDGVEAVEHRVRYANRRICDRDASFSVPCREAQKVAATYADVRIQDIHQEIVCPYS